MALGYNGQIWLLSDTHGGGKPCRAVLDDNTLRAPIGMALTPPGYPRGEGVFVAAKGKLALIVDTNGDGRADTEIIVAEGWKELSHGVDALGAALDKEGNIYFGLGTASFTEPYLVDKAAGTARYDLESERGTILKVSPDFQQPRNRLHRRPFFRRPRLQPPGRPFLHRPGRRHLASQRQSV